MVDLATNAQKKKDGGEVDNFGPPAAMQENNPTCFQLSFHFSTQPSLLNG